MRSLGKYFAAVVFFLGMCINAKATELDAAVDALNNAVQTLATYKDDIANLQDEVKNLKDSQDAASTISTTSSVILEEGAVIAFARPNGCPDGWSLFTEAAGRFVIGVGGKYELPYVAGQPKYQTGGSETHTLIVDEMPSHDHDITFGGSDMAVASPGLGGSIGVRRKNGPVKTDVNGEGDPHNNMPPYIALYICKKDMSNPEDD